MWRRPRGPQFWNLKFGIRAVAILVYLSQMWPYLVKRGLLWEDTDWIWPWTWEHRRLVIHKVATPWSIYNMSISLCWRRPNTGDRDYKLIKKLFTDVTNQVKSRVIFSYAYIKPSFFKPGPLVIPLIGDRSFPTKCMLNSVIYIFVGRYSMIEF